MYDVETYQDRHTGLRRPSDNEKQRYDDTDHDPNFDVPNDRKYKG